LLGRAGLSVSVAPDHLVVTGVQDPETISRTLGEQGVWVRELVPLRPDLESVFLELTGGHEHVAVPRQVDGAPPNDGVIDLDVRESREVDA